MSGANVVLHVQNVVRNFLTSCGEVNENDLLVAGVSGGPDSIAMLHAVHAVSVKLNIKLHCVHVEHGIRGEASRDDAAFTASFCESHEIGCSVHAIDVPGRVKRTGESTQVAARSMRHAILQAQAEDKCLPGRARILIAHNMSDRAETVLLNMARGTGLDGLAAMPAVKLPYLRPMLTLRRNEIEEYCTASAIQPRRDASNESEYYARNRIRQVVIPALTRAVDGDPISALRRLAECASVETSYLNSEAEKVLQAAIQREDEAQITLDAKVVLAAHAALQPRALRLAIMKLRGNLTDVGSAAVSRVISAAAEGANYSAQLPAAAGEQFVLTHAHGAIAISKQNNSISAATAVEIDICADLGIIEAGNYCLQITDLDELEANPEICARELVLAFPTRPGKRLISRCWHPGDYMHPSGMSGTKKLQDLYTDYKIRSADRLAYPVVLWAGTATGERDEIVAVLGLRSSNETVRISSPSQLRSHAFSRELTTIRVRPLSN